MALAFETQEGRVITDADRVIVKVNRAFSRITGYSAEDAIGGTPRLLSSGLHDASFYANMNEHLERNGEWQGEIWNRRKSGDIYPQWLSITVARSVTGEPTHYLGTLTDISERKSIENELRSLAFYDPLTSLPNRRLLLDRLQQAIAGSARTGKAGALLLLDLDNFKTLNDTLGHDIGDQLLVEVAARIQASVRDSDTVARMGGDEFVVVIDGLDANGLAAAQAESVATKIRAALSRTHMLTCRRSLGKDQKMQKPIEYRCTSSIGVAIFHGEQDGVASLLKKADLAMYESKAAGRNSISFFDRSIQDAFSERSQLYQEIEQAIQAGQFVIHYHPLADGNGGMTEVEALVRWQHPQRGLLQPGEFLPLAEQSRQIIELDHWVLTHACTQLAAWAVSPKRAQLCVTVNISPLAFSQADFVALVLNGLKLTGANPRLLRLEFTEKLVLDDVGTTIAKMSALSEAGVSFSLDDFGTGDSSLTYLKRLPLHQLKISRSLVNDMTTNADAASLVMTVIGLAKSLGLTVIAKGAETYAQQALLTNQHCDGYQSYLFCEPMPLAEFEAFLDSHPVSKSDDELQVNP